MKLKLMAHVLAGKQLRKREKEAEQKKQVVNKNEVNYPDNYVEGKYPFITAMRIRPLSFVEYQICSVPTIQVVDHESIILKMDQLRGARYLTRDKLFRSNRSFPPGATNLQLYGASLNQIIKDAFFGINYATFYIGSPGSGKTYSCIGTQTDPGTLLYFAKDLYEFKEKEFPLARIYVSIFRFSSDFKDLLAMSDSYLQYRQTKWGPFLPGLSTVRTNDLKQFLVFLKIGLKNDGKRDIYKDLNSFSSAKDEKSHFIVKFTVLNRIIVPDKDFISNKSMGSGQSSQAFVQKMCTSTLYFIDTESYIRSVKLENKSINNSMQAFNSCIRSLYEINQKIITHARYVPYDQNKFTNYFKEFLGGKGRCIIIGSLSPGLDNLNDTLRVMKEINWSLNCTGHQKPNQEIIKDQQGSARKNILEELPFLNRMKTEVELIHVEVKKINYNPTLRIDDCDKQIKTIQDVVRSLLHIYHQLVSKTQQLCFIRDQVNSLNRKIIETEVSVIYQLFRTNNIKEFFFVKVVQLMYSHEVQKQLGQMKHLLVFKLRDLRLQLNHMHSIKKQAAEYLIEFRQKQDIQRQNFKELITNFVENFNTYVQWQQFNSFKSFVNPEKDKLEMLRIKARKQCDQYFKELAEFLELNQQDISQMLITTADSDEENYDVEQKSQMVNTQNADNEETNVDNPLNQQFDRNRTGSMMTIDFKSFQSIAASKDDQNKTNNSSLPGKQKEDSNNNNIGAKKIVQPNINQKNELTVNPIVRITAPQANYVVQGKKSIFRADIVYQEADNQKDEEDDAEEDDDEEENNQESDEEAPNKKEVNQEICLNGSDCLSNNNTLEKQPVLMKKSSSQPLLAPPIEKQLDLGKRDILDLLKQKVTIRDLIKREQPFMRSRFLSMNVQKNKMNVVQKMKLNNKNIDFFCSSPNISMMGKSQLETPQDQPVIGQRKFFSVTARDNSQFANQQSKSCRNINLVDSNNLNKNISAINPEQQTSYTNIFDYSEQRVLCNSTREQRQFDLIQNMRNSNIVLRSNFNENLSITLEKKNFVLEPIINNIGNNSNGECQNSRQNQFISLNQLRTSSCSKSCSSRKNQEKNNLLFSSSVQKKRDKCQSQAIRLHQFNLEQDISNQYSQRTMYNFPKGKIYNHSPKKDSNISQYVHKALEHINLE